MSQSSMTECPVCGKSFSLATVSAHVEECLAENDKNNTPKETSTMQSSKATPKDNENKKETPKISWFNQGHKNKGSSNPKVQDKSPPSQTKREMSNLAGKSNAGPPNKRQKTGFFTPNKSENPFFILSNEGKSSEKGPTAVQEKHKDDKGANKPRAKTKGDFMPLAEQMRPCSLEDYVGQSTVLGDNSLLRTLLQANEVPSMILWGPPGCGKTTLAHIIASSNKKSSTARFVTLSATTSGINDIKEVVKVAKNEQQMFRRKTILFVDEIHRFNKTQQDTFLPHVENGTITLIGATTENPSFQLNTALLSRCRVIVLDKLSAENLQKILYKAVESMGCVVDDGKDDTKVFPESSFDGLPVAIEREAIVALSNLCDGDARVALNGLQLAVQSQTAAKTIQKKNKTNSNPTDRNSKTLNGNDTAKNETSKREGSEVIRIKISHIKEGLQRTHLLYDRAGEEHYNIISALHKSMRGSDSNASLYWLARMLVGGETPLYVARRIVRFASEDVGLADPAALNQAVAAYQACHFIGMPECEVILAQAVVYLARAPKSIEVYSAYNNAKNCVKNWDGPHPSVPLHIRNASTKLMKNLGYGAGYKYNPAFNGPVDQTYLPPGLDGTDFFKSTK